MSAVSPKGGREDGRMMLYLWARMTNKWRKNYLRLRLFPRRTSEFSLFNKFDQNQSFTAVSPFHNWERPNSHSGLFICLLAIYLSSSRGTRGARLCGLPLRCFHPRRHVRSPGLCVALILSLKPLRKKPLRTNPTLNFQQRRENTTAVIQFNVVPFRPLSPISFESFARALIHWLYHVSCSHVSVKCWLCNSAAGLLMAWLKPNEIF